MKDKTKAAIFQNHNGSNQSFNYNTSEHLWQNYRNELSEEEHLTIVDGHIHRDKHGYLARFPDNQTAQTMMDKFNIPYKVL